MSADLNSLTANLFNYTAGQDGQTVSNLLANPAIISSPQLYQAAVNVFDEARNLLKSKDLNEREKGVILLLRAYTVLKSVPDSPATKEKTIWSKFSFDLSRHNNKLAEAEKIFTQNFSSYLNAREIENINSSDIEHILNHHTESIEQKLSLFDVGKKEWQDLKKAFSHGDIAKANSLWNNIIAQVRTRSNPQILSNTEKTRDFLLGEASLSKFIPSKNDFSKRFKEHIETFESLVKQRPDSSFPKIWNNITTSLVQGNQKALEKNLHDFLKGAQIINPEKYSQIEKYIFEGTTIPVPSFSSRPPVQVEEQPPVPPPRHSKLLQQPLEVPQQNQEAPLPTATLRSELSAIPPRFEDDSDSDSQEFHTPRGSFSSSPRTSLNEPIDLSEERMSFSEDPSSELEEIISPTPTSSSSPNASRRGSIDLGKEYDPFEDTSKDSDKDKNILYQSFSSDDDIWKLIGKPIPELDARDIAETPSEDLAAFAPEDFSNLTDETIAALTQSQLEKLTPEQYGAIPISQRLNILDRLNNESGTKNEELRDRILEGLPRYEDLSHNDLLLLIGFLTTLHPLPSEKIEAAVIESNNKVFTGLSDTSATIDKKYQLIFDLFENSLHLFSARSVGIQQSYLKELLNQFATIQAAIPEDQKASSQETLKTTFSSIQPLLIYITETTAWNEKNPDQAGIRKDNLQLLADFVNQLPLSTYPELQAKPFIKETI